MAYYVVRLLKDLVRDSIFEYEVMTTTHIARNHEVELASEPFATKKLANEELLKMMNNDATTSKNKAAKKNTKRPVVVSIKYEYGEIDCDLAELTWKRIINGYYFRRLVPYFYESTEFISTWEFNRSKPNRLEVSYESRGKKIIDSGGVHYDGWLYPEMVKLPVNIPNVNHILSLNSELIKAVLKNKRLKDKLHFDKYVNAKTYKNFDNLNEEMKDFIYSEIVDLLEGYAPFKVYYPSPVEQFPDDGHLYGAKGIYFLKTQEGDLFFSQRKHALKYAGDISEDSWRLAKENGFLDD